MAREQPIDTLQISEAATKRQLERLSEVRRTRDQAQVTQTLDALRQAAAGTQNTMPHILNAVRAYATVGEIAATLKDVFGGYTEAGAF